jgi:hypothetical protein
MIRDGLDRQLQGRHFMIEHAQGEVRNLWLFLFVGRKHQSEAPTRLDLKLECGRKVAILLLEKREVGRSNDRERLSDREGYAEQSSSYHEENRERQNDGMTRHECPFPSSCSRGRRLVVAGPLQLGGDPMGTAFVTPCMGS